MPGEIRGLITVPHAQGLKLLRSLFRPALVGGGGSGTGMENLAQSNGQSGCRDLSASRRKTAHADEPLGAQDFQDPAQVRVANLEQRFPIRRPEFVGS